MASTGFRFAKLKKEICPHPRKSPKRGWVLEFPAMLHEGTLIQISNKYILCIAYHLSNKILILSD
jgi:hypothetical protein